MGDEEFSKLYTVEKRFLLVNKINCMDDQIVEWQKQTLYAIVLNFFLLKFLVLKLIY